MIGETLAHYRITQKIGAGGMGEVYRATDSKLHRDVAIKVIAASYANDPERMARFEREAHVLASLSHGSIAAVYGLEDSNGSKALVMELVEGVDLSDRLKQGPLPITEALRTASQIAEALEAAHEHGIIHRDLKPANIKLLPDGRIKLLDFGLAKALEAASAEALADSATLSGGATRAGIIMGTAAYMSPEQATGAPVDKRTDVWAFGVVLFEMLTGQRLFEGQTTSHTLADVIRAEIDFGRLPATTPPDVRGLLERCLDREPRRRLRDIREARLVIDRLLEQRSGSQHSGIHAVPPPPPPARARGFGARQVGAGVAAGVLLAAGAAWLMWPTQSATSQLRVEVRLTDGLLNSDLGPAFDLSPDASRIAFVTGDEGQRELRVRQLDQLDSTVLAQRDNNGEPYHPFFSPDGEWVGFVTATEMRKVPAAGGTPLTICKVNRSRGASWGRDGSIVLAPAPSSGLTRVAAAGGEPAPLTTLNAAAKETTHRWPQVLPGDAAVLFTSHSQTLGDFDNAAIEVVTVATGERKVVQKGGTFGRYISTGHLLFVNKGTLFAVPFDLGSLTTAGTPVPVVREVTSSAEGGAQVAFSGTGLLAYLRGTARTPRFPVVWVDRQSGVTALLDEAGTYGNPRLSPDGRHLSLTVLRNGNWDIWVFDIDRHVLSRLTFDEATDTEQIWSPDGRHLAFGSDRGGRSTNLYRKPSDGSGEEQLIARSDASMWPTTWSPDGRVIAFSANRKTFDVGVVTLGDTPEYQWPAASPFLEADPAFSPDGRWLAYSSNESGLQQIYVRPHPSGSGRWQISDAGGGFARWSRDGRELFYRTNDGVMAASIEVSGDSLRTGKPRQVIAGQFRGGINGINIAGNAFADYDVTADGKRFVMFPKSDEGAATGAGLVTLVTGWFDEVTRTAKP